jgi:hypothetical protein
MDSTVAPLAMKDQVPKFPLQFRLGAPELYPQALRSSNQSRVVLRIDLVRFLHIAVGALRPVGDRRDGPLEDLAVLLRLHGSGGYDELRFVTSR